MKQVIDFLEGGYNLVPPSVSLSLIAPERDAHGNLSHLRVGGAVTGSEDEVESVVNLDGVCGLIVSTNMVELALVVADDLDDPRGLGCTTTTTTRPEDSRVVANLDLAHGFSFGGTRVRSHLSYQSMA